MFGFVTGASSGVGEAFAGQGSSTWSRKPASTIARYSSLACFHQVER